MEEDTTSSIGDALLCQGKPGAERGVMRVRFPNDAETRVASPNPKHL